MDVLYLLIPLSIVLVFAIGAVFWFALKSGQFDDLEGPGFTILVDDDSPAARRPDGSSADAPRAEDDGGPLRRV
jgi:cbb3-type cytochrome oxidase maturation protein